MAVLGAYPLWDAPWRVYLSISPICILGLGDQSVLQVMFE